MIGGGGARAPWPPPPATPMGRTDVGDDERSRRPTISKTAYNNRESEKIVREDRRLSIRLIAERMSIDKETVWQVLNENLHMTKVLCTSCFKAFN